MSPAKVKHLRRYQAVALREAILAFNSSPTSNLLITQPTGSGKTLLLQLLCQYILTARDNPIRKVVVLAPQASILDGFKRAAEFTYKFTPQSDADRCLGLGFMHNGLVPLRPHWVRGSSLKSILGSRGSDKLHLFCHQAVSNSISKNHDAFAVARDCHDVLIVVDEAHHLVENNSLTRVLGGALSRGARVVLTTATPFHSKGELSFIDEHNFRVICRPMSVHMSEGFAPKLVSRVVELPVAYDANRTLPEMAEAFVSRYREAGCPKSLVVIPSTDNTEIDGATRDHAEVFIQHCRELLPEASFFNSIGGGDHVFQALSDESSGRSWHDITLTCNTGRYREGTDDPNLAALFSFTPFQSPVSSVQVPGRIMRPKSADYPNVNYRECSLQVLFVPPGSSTDLAASSLRWILRSEDPIGASILPPLFRLADRLRAYRETMLLAGNPGAVAEITALEQQIQTDIRPLVLHATEDQQLQLLAHSASSDCLRVSDVEQAHGSDSTVAQIAQLAAVARSVDKIDIVDLVRRHRVRRSTVFNLMTAQFETLSLQYDSELVVFNQTSIDASVLVDYYARWNATRGLSDMEKAKEIVAEWPTRSGSKAHGFFQEFRKRYMLSQVFDQCDFDLDPAAYAILQSNNLIEDVLHTVPPIVSESYLLALHNFIPLALWIAENKRRPRQITDRDMFRRLTHRAYTNSQFRADRGRIIDHLGIKEYINVD